MKSTVPSSEYPPIEYVATFCPTGHGWKGPDGAVQLQGRYVNMARAMVALRARLERLTAQAYDMVEITSADGITLSCADGIDRARYVARGAANA